LPPGDHADALLSEIRRRWAIAGTARIIYAHGHEAVTVPGVAANAGLRQDVVRTLLPTAERCLTATFDLALAVAAEAAVPVFASEIGALERLRAGAVELLRFCGREPELATAVLVPCPATARRRELLVATLGRILEDELSRLMDEPPGPNECARSIASAVDLATRRMGRRDRQPLDDLLEPVLEAILTPAIGWRAAQMQAARPAPARHRDARAELWGDRRLSLDLRLTIELIEGLATQRKGAPDEAAR
jgi:AcrR family transcriptional regulator